MKIIDKINNAISEDKIFYSFEYFPPKTDSGVMNLYSRIERMSKLNPMFIDVTWGAGGSTTESTIDISANAQNLVGIECQVHMTCTNTDKGSLESAIHLAKKSGIQNILALRGDPPTVLESDNSDQDNYSYALDLVRLIREKHGDYFGICVAGYPEGHPDGNYEDDLKYLKQKVEAGADFVITQFFYDCDQFLKFVKDANQMGINVPIIPGIMPIQSYSAWKKMCQFCKTKVPQSILRDFESINTDDDAEVRAYGVKLCITMCRYLMNNGVRGLHFYTLNLEKSVTSILEGLELVPESIPRSLPWTATANAIRAAQESVRPIFWANRPKSYIVRTSSWDEFPNGRYGRSSSPAFGELSDYHIIGLYMSGSADKRREMWGPEHTSFESVYQVFVNFVSGKIQRLPWLDQGIAPETKEIQNQLIEINKNGFLTINSQPRVNGADSTDARFGWGGAGGYIYQKAYLEFFTSPENLQALISRIDKYPSLTYHAVNIKGQSFTNCRKPHSVTAVTWGVFPSSEIIQPTVVDADSFLVWKDEAFTLFLKSWACIYKEDSESYHVLRQLHDNFYLVNIVDHDYIDGDIFAIFRDVIDAK